ncbi:MAG TPA: DUF3563 family protein [Bordetella sp.]
MFSLFFRSLSRLLAWRGPSRHDAYLASAIDLAQLEDRMRVWARSQED